MSKQEEYKDDILRKYILSEKRENAPEGFTSNVMTRIQLDSIPSVFSVKERKRNLVPYISVLITMVLIVAAMLMPDDQPDALSSPVISFIKDLRFTIPKLNFFSIFHQNLPSVILYVIIGIIVLSLFDRALYGIFKSEK